MAGLIVKPRARIFHGHEWVYGTEIRKVFGDPLPGDVISLKDYKDRPLGSAIYNPQSQIVARRFSRRKQELDRPFFERRIRRAIDYRTSLGYGEAPAIYRAVWSESDGLPGLVVDRYGEDWAIQTLTLAMDQRKEMIVEALVAVTGAGVVVERNDSSGRKAEGLPKVVEARLGEPKSHSLLVDGIPFQVDLLGGQKTGLYIDQLDNYGKVAAEAGGRRVLDAFANQGGFALHCRKAGAGEVIALESSAAAVEMGRANAAAAELEVRFEEVNAFDFLKENEGRGERFDLIILDPPSFARSKKSLRDALRGYKEIHLRALKMLEPGGLLATFTCSHHVGRQAYLDMIRDAAVDARRTLRLRETLTQRADHPVLPSIPETGYLHGFILEVIPAW